MSGLRVLVYDTTERAAPWLSTWWALGSLVSRSDLVIRADGWPSAYRALARVTLPIDLLQVWGHGDDGRPLLGGGTVDLDELARVLPPTSAVWWRSCEVHRGTRGAWFAVDVTTRLRCTSVGHCVVVSAPNPLVQGAVCALRPGETPWWPVDGAGLRGCSTLRMTIPPWAYRT